MVEKIHYQTWSKFVLLRLFAKAVFKLNWLFIFSKISWPVQFTHILTIHDLGHGAIAYSLLYKEHVLNYSIVINNTVEEIYRKQAICKFSHSDSFALTIFTLIQCTLLTALNISLWKSVSWCSANVIPQSVLFPNWLCPTTKLYILMNIVTSARCHNDYGHELTRFQDTITAVTAKFEAETRKLLMQ